MQISIMQLCNANVYALDLGCFKKIQIEIVLYLNEYCNCITFLTFL